MSRYVCPKCRKPLAENDLVRCMCPSCHSIFDTPGSGGKTAWKSLLAGMQSGHSEYVWNIGSWYEINEDKTNEKDFSASDRIVDAMQDAPMEILAQVEVDGEHFVGKGGKEYWQKIQVISAWKWEKKHSVALSIFAAELTLQNYKNKYPNGDVAQKVIEAAKKWLKDPTEENRLAAQLAGSDAWAAAELAAKLTSVASVRSAWSIIEKSAELAIRSAAQAGWAVAESSALSAKAAAESATLSAKSAAQSSESAFGEILQKCEDWILQHVNFTKLEEIK